MSTEPDQKQYIDLYFDLEQVKTNLVEIAIRVRSSMRTLTDTYRNDDELRRNGFEPTERTPLVIGTRAAVTANLSILMPQLDQIATSLALAQQSCEILCPALQETHSTSTTLH